jgi:hypothetical protein
METSRVQPRSARHIMKTRAATKPSCVYSPYLTSGLSADPRGDSLLITCPVFGDDLSPCTGGNRKYCERHMAGCLV